jgi:hypothetical protein
MGQSLPKRDVRTMSAIHPITTTEPPMNLADPKRTLEDQTGSRTAASRELEGVSSCSVERVLLWDLKSPSFPLSDFKKSGALGSLLLG